VNPFPKTHVIAETFTGSDDFDSYHQAERWLQARGYLTGSMQAGSPTGAMSAAEYSYVAKWRNLSPSEQRACAALIVGGTRGTTTAWVFMRWELVGASVDPGVGKDGGE
jgi:hypothetical protein